MTPPIPAEYLSLRPAVLQILLTLAEEPRHGYGIMASVRERSAGRIDLGTSHLYRHLRRLLEDGLVAEVDAPDAVDRDDPRRRYYGLTSLGTDVLAAEARRLEQVVRQTRALGLHEGRSP